MSTLAVSRETLVFNWDKPRQRSLVFLGFVVLSVIVHAVAFCFFQIVYPPALSLLPPPARVSLITSSSEEGRSILRWLEAEDPALASSTVRPAEMKSVSLPLVEQVPSYRSTEPALRDAPPLIADLRNPSSQPPGPVLLPRSRSRSPEKFATLPTTISFSKELANFGAPLLAAPKFVASTSEAPQAISFRIAIGGRGEILYCFATNSSGDRELDEQARRYLALCRFPGGPASSGEDLAWGTATIEWGNDVASPPQPKSTEPTAP